jgi:hypothetical protein
MGREKKKAKAKAALFKRLHGVKPDTFKKMLSILQKEYDVLHDVWWELCPCLNPLGSTGKRPVGPERSVAALRPFNFFDFFLGFVLRRTGKTGVSYQGSEGKNSAILGPGCIFRQKG